MGFLNFLHFPRKKIVSFLDACDAALDPVYVVLEAGLATWRDGIWNGVVEHWMLQEPWWRD